MMCMDGRIKQSIWFLTLGMTILSTGCTTTSSTSKAHNSPTICTRPNSALQAAHAQVESIKKDMARVQIESAKQKAELYSAHQEIKTLRRTHTSLQNEYAQQKTISQDSIRLTVDHEKPEQGDSTYPEKVVYPKAARLLTINSNTPLRENFTLRLDNIEKILQQLQHVLRKLLPTTPSKEFPIPHDTTTSEDSVSHYSSGNRLSTLPSSISQLSRLEENSDQTKSTHIVVKAGDTLSKLTRQFGGTIETLKSMNHLNSDVIYIGQRLLIPVSMKDFLHTDHP